MKIRPNHDSLSCLPVFRILTFSNRHSLQIWKVVPGYTVRLLYSIITSVYTEGKVCGCEFNMQEPPLCYKTCHITYTFSSTMANIAFLFHSTNCCFLPLNFISDLQSMKSFCCFLFICGVCALYLSKDSMPLRMLELLSGYIKGSHI